MPDDIGLKRSEVGDTPGILDDIGTQGGALGDILQSLLNVGSQFRFGMGDKEKFARTVSGQGIPGFHARQAGAEGGQVLTSAPKSGDVDQAQRALSVASGAQRFGPLLPTIMSLISVDNPSAANPRSSQATRDALSSVQSGAFQGGADLSGAPTGNRGNEVFNQLLTAMPVIGGAFSQSESNYDLANILNTVFGAK